MQRAGAHSARSSRNSSHQVDPFLSRDERPLSLSGTGLNEKLVDRLAQQLFGCRLIEHRTLFQLASRMRSLAVWSIYVGNCCRGCALAGEWRLEPE